MGLGDFLSGAGHAVESMAGSAGGAVVNTAKAAGYAVEGVAKGTEWAVTHPGTIGRDVAKGVEFAGKHAVGTIEGSVKGVGFLASHPQYWGAAAKSMIVDQFTNPVNIISNVAMIGLAVATGGAGSAPLVAKIAQGAEGVSTATKAAEVASGVSKGVKVAEDLSNVATAASAVSKGVETASALSKGADLVKGVDTAVDASRGVDAVSGASRIQRAATSIEHKVDAIAQFPTKLHQGIRESLGMNPLTLAQRARQGMAESFLGHTGGVGLQETDGFLGHVGEAIRQNIGQRIANAPGAPGLVGGGQASSLSQMRYRAGQVSRVANVQNFGSDLKKKATMMEFAANPEKGAVDLVMQNKGQIVDFAAKHAGDQIVSTVKDMFGSKNQQSTMPTVQSSVDPGVTDWQRSNTGMVATKRQSSFDGGAVTTTSSSTAPTSIGPSKWYGQSGYNTGRGFQSPASQQQWGTSPWTQDPAYA